MLIVLAWSVVMQGHVSLDDYKEETGGEIVVLHNISAACRGVDGLVREKYGSGKKQREDFIPLDQILCD